MSQFLSIEKIYNINIFLYKNIYTIVFYTLLDTIK